MNKKLNKIKSKYKLIYNPNSGKKRRFFRPFQGHTVDDMLSLLKQYRIEADKEVTKYPGHAEKIAKEAVRKGYSNILVAGGDGTVSEVAGGVIGTDVVLGILPQGTYMNLAKMLSIPVDDLEKAVELIKIGKTRKIDAGVVTHLEGTKLESPQYFLENAGVGLEAEIQKHFKSFEHGSYLEIFRAFQTIKNFYSYTATIILNKKQKIQTKANIITISNGPYTGAALKLSPTALLNDHRLTVSIYKMPKIKIFKYLYQLKTRGKPRSKLVKTYRAKHAEIITSGKRLVHADGNLFGETPVEFKIIPNALNVIAGFPKEGEASLAG